MRSIWKYPFINFIVGLGSQEFDIPENAIFLDFQIQDEVPTLWFEVDIAQRKVKKEFIIVGTGHEIPDGYSYLGTCQRPPFVWHLYEEVIRVI